MRLPLPLPRGTTSLRSLSFGSACQTKKKNARRKPRKIGLSASGPCSESNPALMNLRLMQSRSAAQNAGNTLVLGVPGGFVPLKSGNAPECDENYEAT